MKKIFFKVTLFLSVVILACVGTNIAIEKQNNKLDFLMGNIEAFATPEDGPGNYHGAVNSYCTHPKGQRGCKTSSEPNKICTLSIYCID